MSRSLAHLLDAVKRKFEIFNGFQSSGLLLALYYIIHAS
jgi:hypothetical protein